MTARHLMSRYRRRVNAIPGQVLEFPEIVVPGLRCGCGVRLGSVFASERRFALGRETPLAESAPEPWLFLISAGAVVYQRLNADY